ncbi:sugar dehydrogenase complex small subunit [Devosia faecipullorum]|uniref:sugar dehydrogenase complex small subunit n=1 Tax=Devosia faecipullorum TaxID=2755039 RepID=UPI00187BB27C|nr:hypothetical protein [Devosia faecipullorum]
MTRRQVLAWSGGTALALVLGGRVSAADPASLEDFLALSARLVGKKKGALSTQFGESYFSALLSRGLGETLRGLRDGDAEPGLETSMISNWYTGVAETKGGDEVVTYTEALMWEALDFTKPMGWCGGETGYWTDAPEGEA